MRLIIEDLVCDEKDLKLKKIVWLKDKNRISKTYFEETDQGNLIIIILEVGASHRLLFLWIAVPHKQKRKQVG